MSTTASFNLTVDPHLSLAGVKCRYSPDGTVQPENLPPPVNDALNFALLRPGQLAQVDEALELAGNEKGSAVKQVNVFNNLRKFHVVLLIRISCNSKYIEDSFRSSDTNF